MNANDFAAWLSAAGLLNVEAAELLGVSRVTITNYRAGLYPIPRTVALACAALSAGLEPWTTEMLKSHQVKPTPLSKRRHRGQADVERGGP